MKKAAIHTLGCKVNQYESEAIASMMQEAGYEMVPFDGYADCYIVNTCTVTSLSDRKSRQMIRRAKKHNPNAIVVATGCYAQTAPEAVSQIEGVNLVVGTAHRAEIPDLIEQAAERQVCTVGDIMQEREFESLHVSAYQERTRAFLKIQDGCDRYCSYCIIPYARGRVRSRPLADIISEVEELCEKGYCEFVLSGIHVASYGKDLENIGLLNVLEQVDRIKGVKRVRLGSLEPGCITKEFVTALAAMDKFCPHFHISLQSGSARTLERMNRHYTPEEYLVSAEVVRDSFKNPAISTDVMVGFCGETEEEFEESYQFVKQVGFSQIHVFPYSVRKGTRAADFPDHVSSMVKEERASRMLALGESLSRSFLESQQGRTAQVLAERGIGDGMYEGFTENYARVHFAVGDKKGTSDKNGLTGQIMPVKLNRAEKDFIFGQLQM